MFEFYILILTIFLKIYSFYYYIFFRNFLDKYKLLGNYIFFVPFTRYTDLSMFLSLIWSYNSYYYTVCPVLTCSTWCIQCNASIAYWVLKKNIVSKEINSDTFLYKFSEFMCHGGILLLMIFDLNKYKFEFINVTYPIYLSIIWLFFIILPWYYFTGDSVYPFLDKKESLISKFLIFFNILIINITSAYVGFYLSNY